MFLHAQDLTEGATLRADVCIIGAGAAGITLARRLSRSGLDVLLLESGGLTPDPATQDLYRGEGAGVLDRIKKRDYPYWTRLRYFGGTTNHWAGWCRPLDPQDFRRRDWVPLSGWPVTREELDPWYREACSIVGIAPFDGREDRVTNWWRPRLDLDREETRVATKVFFYSNPPTRFGTEFRAELERAPNVRVVLGANCLELASEGDRREVTRVRCATLGGRRFEVRARRYVLACGTLENARVLLHSGLGGDWVGRCFMEHVHAPLGRYNIWRNWYFLRLYTGQKFVPALGNDTRGVLCTTESAQAERRLLNFSVELKSDSFSKRRPVFERALAAAGSRMDARFGGSIRREPAYPYAGIDFIRNPVFGQLYARGEQTPSRESRVTLTGERDALGVPRLRLDWRLSREDYESLAASARLVGEALIASFRGRVKLDVDPSRPDEWEIHVGPHQMGTTRMSETPATGVVDRDLRVHGTANLFVAGASVFATSGFSNPTLTLVALACRLAGRLKEELA